MQKISAAEWREVFALLDTALELPVASRAAWLASLGQISAPVRAALSEMLERQTSASLLAKLPQFTGSPDAALEPALADTLGVGSIVGPYRVTDKLGRGGMSSVWVAERIDGSPRRRVALKLPHISNALPDVARRMERERDLLGSLEHPGIARLYDAGTAGDGRPYLALELVDGIPIDEYCKAHDISIDARIRLILQTARAVAFAHARQIVHRDLKPANILVDTGGQVHLLDFGVGKLLEDDARASAKDTQFSGRLFTPDYASPEQLRGDAVDMACDVFSLGVVLYQLLCAQLPFSARTAAGTDIAGDVEARAPSVLATRAATRQALRGDLDTITLKALKYTPSQRYSSMSALADDLERFLRGEPVLARPDSAWYRLRKLAQRHRRTVVAVTITAVLAAVGGIGLYLHQTRSHLVATRSAIEESAEAMARRSVPVDAPRDVSAYHDYLRARSLMLRPTEANLTEILKLAQSATTRDPYFAHAFALLSGANVLFLDLGYENPDALPRADLLARQALRLDPQLPGAHATLGSIAAHRGQWLEASAHFERAYALDDQTGRIHARHAQTVLMSLGRIEDAVREYRAEFRLTPAHARGAMQVAQGLALKSRHDAEVLRFLDIALSLGWPVEERDVNELLARTARRAGRMAEAADYLARALPPGIRSRADAGFTALLHGALREPLLRTLALAELAQLDADMQATTAHTFSSLMFYMNWYVAFGDLETAFATAHRWADLAGRTGVSGIPHIEGFWIDEMRAFRADARFHDIAVRLGMLAYWRQFGPPDGCRLEPRFSCRDYLGGS